MANLTLDNYISIILGDLETGKDNPNGPVFNVNVPTSLHEIDGKCWYIGFDKYDVELKGFLACSEAGLKSVSLIKGKLSTFREKWTDGEGEEEVEGSPRWKWIDEVTNKYESMMRMIKNWEREYLKTVKEQEGQQVPKAGDEIGKTERSQRPSGIQSRGDNASASVESFGSQCLSIQQGKPGNPGDFSLLNTD